MIDGQFTRYVEEHANGVGGVWAFFDAEALKQQAIAVPLRCQLPTETPERIFVAEYVVRLDVSIIIY